MSYSSISLPTESSAILSNEKPLEEQLWWKITHWLGFFAGGSLFIAGTALYFFPDWPPSGELAGVFYTVGSLGFLYVDVLEFFTFTDEPYLRFNISLSATGSFFYVVGSVGFFPSVFAENPVIGEYGFILGSAFIGCSQMWKTARLCGEPAGACGSKDTFTAIGVEFNAGIGAWCFFVGTIMFVEGPLEGPWYEEILKIWLAGSFFFWFGSLFLGFRHFAMGL